MINVGKRRRNRAPSKERLTVRTENDALLQPGKNSFETLSVNQRQVDRKRREGSEKYPPHDAGRLEISAQQYVRGFQFCEVGEEATRDAVDLDRLPIVSIEAHILWARGAPGGSIPA